jgi:transposase
MLNETKEDARKISSAELKERRNQVIRAFKRGVNQLQISRDVGMSYQGVRGIVRRYKENGSASITPKVRGRKEGTQRYLDEAQENDIKRLICEKRPEQLKMDFALWNRVAVGQLVEQQFGIKLGVRAIGNYLARWGFTPQRPIKRAYEQRPEAVKKWLDEQYPDIAKRAKVEGAEIHWGDETAVVNTDVRGRSYAPRGKTPVTYTVGGTRHKLSMIATVSNRGKAHWMMIEEAFNADKLIEFMELLIRDAGQNGTKKLFLILDNLRVHHSKPVKAWAELNKDKIELFYLPSYSPELNPEERLNADLKHVIRSKVPVRTKDKLKQATTEHMNMIVQNPERVKAYFGDQFVSYAA